MFKLNPLRQRQFIGILAGLLIGLFAFYFFSLKSSEQYVSLGPMNTGHGELSCVTCHADASGNLFQQVQSNISYAVGARKNSVDFGTSDVAANNCLECHDRPNDRHPIYRFEEPRFKDALKNIDATTCITCHIEHNDKRITLAAGDYCMNCHQDLEVENDPIDIEHKLLIAQEKWSTCLQCHDFHGNHKYEVPHKMKDTIPMKAIKDYFNGGKDPFGDDKKYRGLSEADWLNTLVNK